MMGGRSWDDWIEEYSEGHQHPMNKLTHKIGIPMIVLSLPVMLFKKLGLPYDKVKFVSIGAHAARMQAVIAGKADAALVNEITAQIGPKGNVLHTDHAGGSQFAEGAVPCLMKIVEGASFKKPTSDAGPPPHVTFRVKLSRE